MRLRHPRGFSMIEVMMSAAVLAVGVLGVAASQVLAANQNGMARRTSRAALVARDFVENASRWEFMDPRLGAGGKACGAGTTVDEATLGNDQIPLATMDFTAMPATDSLAASLASTTDGLFLGGSPYDGAARYGNGTVLGPTSDRIELMWSVRLVNLNLNIPGCEAKEISVAVRYPISSGSKFYRNVITKFLKYDSRALGVTGIPEQI